MVAWARRLPHCDSKQEVRIAQRLRHDGGVPNHPVAREGFSRFLARGLRRGAAGVALLCVLVSLGPACAPREEAPAGTARDEARTSKHDAERSTPPAAARRGPSPRSNVGFRTRELLAEHYRKHGEEFGRITMDEYLRGAQDLRDRAAGGATLEIVRDDGVVTRFDRSSGAFIAFGRSGVIRTYFRPRDGERYFRRQALRSGG